MKRPVSAAALLAMALLPGAGAAQQSDEEWVANCMEQNDQGRLVSHCDVRVMQMAAPGGPLRVDPGENGGVSIVGWSGSGVEIHARVQARGVSAVAARALSENILVRPGATIATSGPENTRDASWHVSYLIYVPSNTDLELSTSNGPLSVRGVASRMSLETDNGPLALREVGGDVYARTQNGPISVSLSGNAWRGAGLDAETRNGPATLTVPEGFNAQLEAGTNNGPFSSDVPLQVTLQGRMRGPVSTTLGSGGAPVRLITSNGPMSIRRVAGR